MLRLIYKLYFLRFSNQKVDSFYKRVMIRILNILLWVYYKMTGPFTGKRVLQSDNTPSLILSLTTYPARIDKIWMVIETLLDQTVKPDKIMLWLYEGEFPEKDNLPADLLKLEKRGVEIHFCNENLYPHKKYYYTMKKYPDTDLITV